MRIKMPGILIYLSGGTSRCLRIELYIEAQMPRRQSALPRIPAGSLHRVPQDGLRRDRAGLSSAGAKRRSLTAA